MVKHVVSFKLTGTPDERREIANKFRDALLKLPQQIEVLKEIQVGLNANPAEDWDITLIATVPQMADVAVYATHPAHVAAAAIVAPHKEARACVDFYED